MSMLSHIYNNKVVFYLSSRYLTYALQFLTSMLIATKLGAYYLGVWGVITLLISYFQQFHFGIANSFNILYVQHREEKKECDLYKINSLALISYLSIIVIALYVYYKIFGTFDFEKYNADKYVIWICIIVIMQYFVQFFINLFRVHNLLNHVAFCQSIVVLLNFFPVLFFHGEELIGYLVFGYLIGNLIIVILAFSSRTLPAFSFANIQFKYQKLILQKGFYLFLYNSCFYLIIITIKTVISVNYSVEEFGFFTFSYTLAHAIILVLEALLFIIFPKVIGKLSSNDVSEVKETISLLRNSYLTSAHLLIYFSLVLFPFILYLMPQYTKALDSLNLIAITILTNTCSFGYAELMLSHNKEKTMAFLSAFALILNYILALLLVDFINVSFSFVILSTLVTYFIYTFIIYYKSISLIDNQKVQFFGFFPLRLFIPYSLALLLSIFHMECLLFCPLTLFILLNWKECIGLVKTIKLLIYKPDVINL